MGTDPESNRNPNAVSLSVFIDGHPFWPRHRSVYEAIQAAHYFDSGAEKLVVGCPPSGDR